MLSRSIDGIAAGHPISRIGRLFAAELDGSAYRMRPHPLHEQSAQRRIIHSMFGSDRMTVEQFFDWQQIVEGRYELVDGRIVPHPDYVTPHGLAAPSNRHAAIVGKLAFAFQSTLKPPCLVYVGAGAKVDRMSANIPDLAVSCDRDDLEGKALKSPRFICEVLSPSTRRVDTLRKVGDYLAIASVEAYIIVDGERRTVTVHRPDAGPQTWDESATIQLSDDISLRVAELLA